MKLSELLHGCEYSDIMTTSMGQLGDVTSQPDTVDHERSISISLDRDISGVAYNSQKIKKGYLFVAIKGEIFDGHDFIQDALKMVQLLLFMKKGSTYRLKHCPLE